MVAGFPARVTSGNRRTPFTVVSFNIRYQDDRDRQHPWSKRKNAVIEVITFLDPDLLGLQEALSTQLEDLDAGLPGYRLVGVGRDDGKKKGEFAAIYYREARFKHLASGNFWFSDTPEIPSNTWGNACIRMATWIMLEDRRNDKGLLHVNLHLDHRNKEARYKSVALLIDKLHELHGSKYGRVIDRVVVTGDFNDNALHEKTLPTLLDSRIEATLGYRLLDARNEWKKQGNPVGPPYTWHAFTGRHPRRFGRKVRALIDHVLYSSTLDLMGYEIFYRDIKGVWPSDHFPVKVVLA